MSKQTQMAVLTHLAYASRKDAEKAGFGLRTTGDVADALALPMARARSALNALSAADLVDCFDESPLLWRITAEGRAALATGEASR